VISWFFGESEFEKTVKSSLTKLSMEVLKMAKEIEALKAQVTALVSAVRAEGDAVLAATIAIKGLTDQQVILTAKLQEAIDASDPVAIQEATNAIAAQNAEIIAQTEALAAAIPAQPEVG